VARIRSIKPETWTSESLAEVSLTAERTFLGLLNLADDHGRFRDNAAVIAGLLWPLRSEHTAVHVEDDLEQLASAELICRYTGCDDRRYLHIVTWAKHQKIDKPSQSRLPTCPLHHAAQRCGACKGTCVVFDEGSANVRVGLGEDSPKPPAAPEPAQKTPAPARPADRCRSASPASASAAGPEGTQETAGQKGHGEGSPKAPRSLGEGSVSGSRILDPGSGIPSGPAAPAPSDPSAQQLVAAYVAACAQRPPRDVIGHLGRVVKQLLAEGIAAEHVRAGLERFTAKPMHPSVLPSLVNEAMNAGLARPDRGVTVPGHRPWSNPADPATAYAEEL
jgi:hypothetical protein